MAGTDNQISTCSILGEFFWPLVCLPLIQFFLMVFAWCVRLTVTSCQSPAMDERKETQPRIMEFWKGVAAGGAHTCQNAVLDFFARQLFLDEAAARERISMCAGSSSLS